MGPDDLIALIEALRQRAQTYDAALHQSESLTRYALIDPLLRALGWDTGDPGLVRPEYAAGSGSADYALFDTDSSPLVLLEAKKLGEKLPPIAMTAVVGYAGALAKQGAWVKLLGSTSGILWELYEYPTLTPKFAAPTGGRGGGGRGGAPTGDQPLARAAQAKNGLMGGMPATEQTMKAYADAKAQMPKVAAEANALFAKAATLGPALAKYNLTLTAPQTKAVGSKPSSVDSR